MQSREEAIKEVKDYIASRIISGVDVDVMAAEIVDADDGSGHGEVRGVYTLSKNPLVISFEPVADEAN